MKAGRQKIRIAIPIRVAGFFLVPTHQIGNNIANDHKLYQTDVSYTKWP
jgi:hypothetical protein